MDNLEREQSGHKQIKKTGLMVNGKKIFITMNGDKYQARYGGEILESEPRASLTDFKDKVREKWGNPNQQLPKNNPEVAKATDTLQKILDENPNIYKQLVKQKAYKIVAMDSSSALKFSEGDRYAQLATNTALVDKGLKPIMAPFMFTDYNGMKYNCYDLYYMNDIKAVNLYTKEFRPYDSDLSVDEKSAMKFYSYKGDRLIRQRLMGKPFTKYHLGEFDLEKKTPEEQKEAVDKQINQLSNYLDKNRLKENLILSRRMDLNESNRSYFEGLKAGDTFKDKSFTSFSLQQIDDFGSDFQITLLAKEGQPVNAIQSVFSTEMEFLTQKGSTFKVLEAGTNSVVVEIVD